MFCCALAILIMGPLGFIARPWLARVQGTDCCARRRLIFAGSIVACLAMIGLGWALLYPAPFRHICTFPYAAAARL
jgi:hypothetical protein